jgi:hypothetical protein
MGALATTYLVLGMSGLFLGDSGLRGLGPDVVAGAGWSISPRQRVELLLDAGRGHDEYPGVFRDELTVVSATARLLHYWADGDARARPFVSGGVSIVHRRASFTTRGVVEHDRSTAPAVEAGIGVDVAGARWSIRPELGLQFALPSETQFSSVPVATMRAAVTIGWRVR